MIGEANLQHNGARGQVTGVTPPTTPDPICRISGHPLKRDHAENSA